MELRNEIPEAFKRRQEVPYKFWKDYYNSDIIDREKRVENLRLVKMLDDYHGADDDIKPAIKDSFILILMSFFDDIGEYYDTKE